MTKKEVLSALVNEEVVKGNEDYLAYVKNELALLDKRAENRKPTKAQKENEVLKAIVLKSLESGEGTVTEIGQRAEETKGLTNQKVTALLKLLVNDGLVVKDTSGKKTVFSLAETVATE